MTDALRWFGEWEIKTINKVTGKIKIEKIKNRIMDAALVELTKALSGVATDVEVLYLALGTSNTAVTNSDTQLGVEIFRTPYTAKTLTDNELNTVYTVLDSEAVAVIEEVGVFGGSAATAAANSGMLISRILWTKDKTTNEELQFSRTDKLTR